MTSGSNGMKAVLWNPATDNTVQCQLCAHRCLIRDGKTGRCCVRKNVGGVLYSLSYGKICAANADPIEKKPLFHFLPGSRSFSVATEGCNLRCEFCQNWQISQAPIEHQSVNGQRVDLQNIVDTAIESQCQSIAYTYTEPTVFMELCAECGRLAKSKGIANVFVSNGYQTREAIDFAKEWLDGINVDLKAFDPAYYKTLCHADLLPVLDTIEYIARDTDIWLEITTLVIPGQNDAEDQLKQLADFLVSKAGPDVPWHVSRFHPQYKFRSAAPTPIATLERAYEIGKQAGLNYVYLGNVPGSQTESTFFPQCHKLLIERIGYTIQANYLRQGCCPDCHERVAGVF